MGEFKIIHYTNIELTWHYTVMERNNGQEASGEEKARDVSRTFVWSNF